jgi:purine-binding chemotaxis protein CheW
MSSTSSGFLCTFEVHGHLLGLPAQHVQEVLVGHAITSLPKAPSMVRGLMNLRGQIVPVLDLATRLALPGARVLHPANAPMVLVRTPEGPVSLLVERIGDVVDVHGLTLEPVPDALVGEQRLLLLGSYKLAERLLIAIDSARVVETGCVL